MTYHKRAGSKHRIQPIYDRPTLTSQRNIAIKINYPNNKPKFVTPERICIFIISIIMFFIGFYVRGCF